MGVSIVSGDNLLARADVRVAIGPDIPTDVSRRAALDANTTVRELERQFASLSMRKAGFDQGFLSGIGWIHCSSMPIRMNGI
jgi:hypothetical protein